MAEEAKDRKLIRDAGIGILMFAALGVFIVLLVMKYTKVPWQAWIAPGVLAGVGAAILARSITAAWIAFAGMAFLGVGGAIGVLRDGGSIQQLIIWPAIGVGVCAMLYRSIAAMKRLKSAQR